MVYIQSDPERKLPHHFDAACALYGAKDSSQEFRLTSLQEVSSGKFDMLIKQHLFVGSVEFMNEVFKRVGIVVPALKNPFQLNKKAFKTMEELQNDVDVIIKNSSQLTQSNH